MAASTLLSIFDTVKDLASRVDGEQVQRLTGQRVDSVDQFMARTGQTPPRNFGRGFLAGVIGGIVGAGVKLAVERYTAPQETPIEEDFANDLVNRAEGYAGLELSAQQEAQAELALEVGLGALLGGLYGLAVEALPTIRHDKTRSASLLETTQKLAGPAVGLAPKILDGVPTDNLEKLAGNAAYGATLEIVRRAARHYMETR